MAKQRSRSERSHAGQRQRLWQWLRRRLSRRRHGRYTRPAASTSADANTRPLANASLSPKPPPPPSTTSSNTPSPTPSPSARTSPPSSPSCKPSLPIERVTLWSPQQPAALRALWITNTSNLTLDRGSFSIVENGSFGGEGLLDPIHPDEKRLLSYAADQAVRVTTVRLHNTRRVKHLTIAKGVLTETSIDVAELTYDVHNAAPDPRTVIIEQPVRQGWTLDSDPKPTETTPTTYRFRVGANAGETVHLHIGERHTNFQYIRLVDRNEDQLTLILAKPTPAPPRSPRSSPSSPPTAPSRPSTTRSAAARPKSSTSPRIRSVSAKT